MAGATARTTPSRRAPTATCRTTRCCTRCSSRPATAGTTASRSRRRRSPNRSASSRATRRSSKRTACAATPPSSARSPPTARSACRPTRCSAPTSTAACAATRPSATVRPGDTMTNEPRPRRHALRMLLVALVAAGATALVMMLNANVAQRQAEAAQTSFTLVPLDETTVDPAQWGKNFPRQFDAYLRTVDAYATRFGGGGGSDGLPQDKLKADPRLVTIFDGYAFALDYRQRQGHAHMLDDQRTTRRVTERPQTGACLHCHAANTVAYREAGLRAGAAGALTDPLVGSNGQAQLMAGFEAVCKLPYSEATKLVAHPVGCIDCHEIGRASCR